MTNLSSLSGGSNAPASPNLQVAPQPANSTAASGETLPPVRSNQPVASASEQPEIDVAQVVGQLSDFASAFQRNLSFSVNSDTGQTIIVVSDSETDEVIRQIPSEFAVQLAQNLDRLRDTLDLGTSTNFTDALGLIDSRGNLLDANA